VAAEYEVNIKLNTQQVERQLKSIDTRTKRTGRMATENINALVKGQDKRARLMIKINELESKGLNVAKLRKQMGKATEELAKRRFGSLQQEFRLLTRTLRLEESKLRILRQQQQGFASSPLRGTATMAGSPAQIAASARAGGPRSPIGGAANIAGSPAARRAGRQRLEQVGLGAGFPLLFGGGPGSVLGGAAGGLTGSFGAQIALSAIGQQIDQFIAGVAEAGKAFGSLEGVLSLMSERSLFTSKSSEQLAQQLEELGDVEALAELATVELASKIGSDGIEAFQDLETELDEFDRLVGHLMISLQAFVAGPLGDFLNIVNATLGKKVTQGTIDRLAGSLQDPTDQARFRAAAKQRIGTELEIQGFGLGGLPRSAEVLKSAPLDLLSELSQEVAGGKFGKSNLLGRPLKITRQDREFFKPDRNIEEEKAAREETRIQKRLGRLEEERKKVLEISRFKDKIAAAEASQDKQLVIRLKGEQKIAEIEAKRKQDLVDITDQRLIDQININAATEKLVAHRETERGLAEFQKTSAQERFDAMQKHIEQQYELNEAVKQQAALAKRIAETLGQGMAQSFDALIDGAQNWGAALQDIAANVLRDIAKQLIQIYVIEQAIGFLSAYLTPFAAGTPLGAGGGQVGRFGTLGPNYGIPQFANGGNPPVGRPSLVGERGPELFVPRSAGTIVPNNALGGSNIVVNVDASGSSVEGDAQQSKALGQAIGAAVQAEIIKQKMPGGLLN
tara:strand:- start:432 stop:2636 length:2205 start_codon:yes stop_codon:yes gene_type:complete